jgi:hypothetical protein
VGSTPLALTIVWHPSCEGGPVAAEALAEWFEPVNASNLISGLRIPVRIRCEPESGKDGDPPLAVALDDADVNVVVVLGTKKLIEAASGAWSGFFQKLVDDMDKRGLRDSLTVAALEKDELAIAQDKKFRQAARTYEWRKQPMFTSNGVKLSAGPGLLRLAIIIADTFAGRLLMLEKKDSGNGEVDEESFIPPRHTLFLSHTKHDSHGLCLASRIFDLLQKNPYQLDVFFDAQHLRGGYNFWYQLTDAISKGSFLAIATDKYAGRPVCQFEMLEAKRLRRPVLMAHLVEKGEDRAFPYGGNIPVRILPKEPSGTEIDLLLLDISLEHLRSLSFRREARTVEQKHSQGGAAVEVLCRKPELSDMAVWKVMKTPPTVVIYPDPPLANHELKLISDLAGNISFKALSEG